MSNLRLSSRQLIFILPFISLMALNACSSGGGEGARKIPLSGDGVDVLEDDPGLVVDPLSGYTDCDLVLPCAWTTEDSGISVTVEAVTEDTLSGRPEIAYTLQTTRDTRIQLLDTAQAVDSGGRRYSSMTPEITALDTPVDFQRTIELLAGIRLSVVQPLRESTNLQTRSIARFTFEFIEVGESHKVGFLALPLSSNAEADINCALRLPCEWEAANGEFIVSVLLAEGVQNGRLTIHYQVEAMEDILLEVDAGSVAVGNEGTVFDPKIQTLGTMSDYRVFELPIFEDEIVTGTQSYFRTGESTATKLKKFSLKITQVGAPSAGSPVFRNIPVN